MCVPCEAYHHFVHCWNHVHLYVHVHRRVNVHRHVLSIWTPLLCFGFSEISDIVIEVRISEEDIMFDIDCIGGVLKIGRPS